MVKAGERPICYGVLACGVFNFLKAWSISEDETPVRPFVKTSESCQVVAPMLTEVGICGVNSGEMKLEAEMEVVKD